MVGNVLRAQNIFVILINILKPQKKRIATCAQLPYFILFFMLTCHEVELFISFGKITDFIQRTFWLLVAKDPNLRIKDIKTHEAHSSSGWFWFIHDNRDKSVETCRIPLIFGSSEASKHLFLPPSETIPGNTPWPIATSPRSTWWKILLWWEHNGLAHISLHLCFATTVWSTTKRRIPSFGRNFSRWCVLIYSNTQRSLDFAL